MNVISLFTLLFNFDFSLLFAIVNCEVKKKWNFPLFSSFHFILFPVFSSKRSENWKVKSEVGLMNALQDCNVISMSGLQIYTYFCFTILYLLLLWLLLYFANFISDLLYLLLVCILIPMSVISNSGFLNFTGYGIVRYTVFCAPRQISKKKFKDGPRSNSYSLF